MIAEELRVAIRAETAGAQREISRVGQSSERATQSFAKMAAKYASAGAALALTVREIRQSLRAWGDLEAAQNRVAAAAAVNGENLDEVIPKYNQLASDIQELTVVSDDAALEMIALAQSMGVASSDMDEVIQGAVGISRTFGMNTNQAIRAVTNAMNGNFQQLQRYVPAIRDADTEAEKLAATQELMANSFEQAQAETDTYLGQLAQMENAFSDVREEMGATIARGVEPFIGVLTRFANRTAEAMGRSRELRDIIAGLNDETGDGERSALELMRGIEALNAKIADSNTGIGEQVRLIQQRTALEEELAEFQQANATAQTQVELERARAASQANVDAKEAAELEKEKAAVIEMATQRMEEMRWESLSRAEQEIKTIQSEIDELAELRQRYGEQSEAYQQIQRLINALVSERDELVDSLEDEEDALGDLVTAYNRVTDATQEWIDMTQGVRSALDDLPEEAEDSAEDMVKAFADAAQEILSQVNIVANSALSLWATMNQASNQRTRNEIANINKELDALEEKHERQLAWAEAAGATEEELSEMRRNQLEERQRAEEAADEQEAELKRKQFEREQQMRIAQTIQAGAQAVVNALASIPFPMNLAAAGTIAAMTAAEVGTIRSQEPPAFERGGSFTTNGEQLIRVGDGQSPRERVTVEPLSGPYARGSGGGDIHVHINGVVGSKEAVANWVNEAIRKGRARGRIRSDD